MVTLIICFVWFYNVVKHCNRTDSVLKLLFGNSFERSRLIILKNSLTFLFVCLFVFVALRPKSTAMVIAGRSVN